MDTDSCFKGLKVLDLSSILAGPLTASFFAELGAEVTKIENKLTNGDATRQWKLPTEAPDQNFSAYYFSANYGKKVILMDLTSEADQLRLATFIAESDVVISNFQKKTALKLDLMPDEIFYRHPHLIFAQLSAYDFDDTRPGYDLVMQGETGWLSMTGTDEAHLSKLPVAMIDVIAAHQMKEAILIAMLRKAQNGKGGVVHVSLFKSGLSALANQATNYLMADHIPKPLGTLHPNIAPYGDQYLSKDELKFILACGSDQQFKKLWFTLNVPKDLYLTFDSNSKRLSSRNHLNTFLQSAFSQLDFNACRQIFETINMPFCLIRNMQQVFLDPDAQDVIKSYDIDGHRGKCVSSIAFKVSQ